MSQAFLFGTVLVAAFTAGVAQTPAEGEIAPWAASLARNVPRADRDVYLHVDSPWKNPILMLDLPGISIGTGGEASGQATDVQALAEDLASLPAAAWPLGRVVLLVHTGRAFPFILLSGGTESPPPFAGAT